MPAKPTAGPMEFPPARIDGYVIERRLSAPNDPRQIYEATSTADGGRVALKLVPIADRPYELVDDWLREVARQQAIEHRNVAAVRTAAVDGSWFYVATEFVHGPTLRTLTSAAALPVDRVISLARGIAAGLDAVHAAGSLHRDLRPETIVVDPAGHAVLGDLGVGAAADAARDPRVSRYAAPETLAGAPLDRAANVYSLAAVMCEAVTGRIPSNADRAGGDSSVPRSLVVERAFAAGLSLDPRGRPPTAAALVTQVADAYGIAEDARPDTTASKRTSARPRRGESDPQRTRARRTAAVAAVLIAGGLAFAGGRWFGSEDEPPPSVGASTVAADGVLFSLPPDWQSARTPRQLAALVPGATAWRPLGLPEITLLGGEIAPAEVPRLLAKMRDLDPPSGEPMIGGRAQARRYSGQLAGADDVSLTALLVPTATGVTSVTCVAGPAASESSTRTCGQILRTARPRRSASAPANPGSAEIAALASAVRGLNDARRRGAGALERARTSRQQAAAARALSARYAAAATAAAAITYTPLASSSGRSLTRALEAGQRAYRGLANAASDHSPTRFGTARRRVLAADGGIETALRELALLGYRR